MSRFLWFTVYMNDDDGGGGGGEDGDGWGRRLLWDVRLIFLSISYN